MKISGEVYGIFFWCDLYVIECFICVGSYDDVCIFDDAVEVLVRFFVVEYEFEEVVIEFVYCYYRFNVFIECLMKYGFGLYVNIFDVINDD